MCIFCDGGTLDELQFRLHQEIACHGFAVVWMEGRTPGTRWAYTIGLSEHEEHPELVLRGRTPADAFPILRALGHQVVQGQALHAGAWWPTANGPCLLRAVPASGRQLSWLVAGWVHYYRALGSAPPLRLLDVCPLSLPGEPAHHAGPIGAADPWAPS